MTTITDAYGRIVTVTTNIDGSGQDQYEVNGIAIQFPTGTAQSVALSAINSMATSTPAKTNWTFLEFVNLFSPSEQAAIVSSNDHQVKLFTLMAAGAGTLQLTNPIVIEGVNYLVSLGLLTSDNAALILSGQPSQ